MSCLRFRHDARSRFKCNGPLVVTKQPLFLALPLSSVGDGSGARVQPPVHALRRFRKTPRKVQRAIKEQPPNNFGGFRRRPLFLDDPTSPLPNLDRINPSGILESSCSKPPSSWPTFPPSTSSPRSEPLSARSLGASILRKLPLHPLLRPSPTSQRADHRDFFQLSLQPNRYPARLPCHQGYDDRLWKLQTLLIPAQLPSRRSPRSSPRMSRRSFSAMSCPPSEQLSLSRLPGVVLS